MEPDYHLKYPIGKAKVPEHISETQIRNWIQSIENLPHRIDELTSGLSQEQLDTPYRDGGWTIRQVIHHLADSHLNSFIRFKWALTEDQPKIKAYYEDRWALLPDSKNAPIELSLNLLKALHKRWVVLLKSLNPEDLKKSFIHPDGNLRVSLGKNIGIYAWHGAHHYAHIENLLKRKGWI